MSRKAFLRKGCFKYSLRNEKELTSEQEAEGFWHEKSSHDNLAVFIKSEEVQIE